MKNGPIEYLVVSSNACRTGKNSKVGVSASPRRDLTITLFPASSGGLSDDGEGGTREPREGEEGWVGCGAREGEGGWVGCGAKGAGFTNGEWSAIGASCSRLHTSPSIPSTPSTVVASLFLFAMSNKHCSTCDKDVSASNWAKHLKSAKHIRFTQEHKVPTSFQCTQCDKTYASAKNFRRHKKAVHENKSLRIPYKYLSFPMVPYSLIHPTGTNAQFAMSPFVISLTGRTTSGLGNTPTSSLPSIPNTADSALLLGEPESSNPMP